MDERMLDKFFEKKTELRIKLMNYIKERCVHLSIIAEEIGISRLTLKNFLNAKRTEFVTLRKIEKYLDKKESEV